MPMIRHAYKVRPVVPPQHKLKRDLNRLSSPGDSNFQYARKMSRLELSLFSKTVKSSLTLKESKTGNTTDFKKNMKIKGLEACPPV